MAVSFTLSQDLVYPMTGEVVTLRARNGTAGNRIRWRLASKPADSSLVVYSAQDSGPWLGGKQDNFAELAPDTHGTYVLTAVEETFDSDIPHFHGQGSASLNPVEHWTVATTEDYTVYVGLEVERRIGVAPHQATVKAWLTASGPATEGVLTAWFDPGRAPRIHSPTTDVANAAMGASEVVAHLARIGGAGYTGSSDLVVADGTGSGFLYSPFTILALLELHFNSHRVNTTNAIHGAADAADKIGLALPTTEALLITYCNTFRTNYGVHITKGGPTHPTGADLTNVLAAAAAADLAGCVTLLQDIKAKYSAHRVLHVGSGHSDPGDGRNRESPWILATGSDLDTTCAYAFAFGTVWDAHMDALGPGAAYHALSDTFNTVGGYNATTLEDLIAKANMFADMLGSHCTNIRSDTMVEAVFHTNPDHGGDMSTVPRASDWTSAVELIDTCARIFARHMDDDRSDTWHPAAAGTPDVNAGTWYTQLYGVSYLNQVYQDAVASSTLGSPGNSIAAINNVLTWGGFTKAAG